MQKAAWDFPPPTVILIGSMPQAMLIVPLIMIVFLKVVLENKYRNVSFVIFIEIFLAYSWRVNYNHALLPWWWIIILQNETACSWWQ